MKKNVLQEELNETAIFEQKFVKGVIKKPKKKVKGTGDGQSTGVTGGRTDKSKINVNPPETPPEEEPRPGEEESEEEEGKETEKPEGTISKPIEDVTFYDKEKEILIRKFSDSYFAVFSKAPFERYEESDLGVKILIDVFVYKSEEEAKKHAEAAAAGKPKDTFALNNKEMESFTRGQQKKAMQALVSRLEKDPKEREALASPRGQMYEKKENRPGDIRTWQDLTGAGGGFEDFPSPEKIKSKNIKGYNISVGPYGEVDSEGNVISPAGPMHKDAQTAAVLWDELSNPIKGLMYVYDLMRIERVNSEQADKMWWPNAFKKSIDDRLKGAKLEYKIGKKTKEIPLSVDKEQEKKIKNFFYALDDDDLKKTDIKIVVSVSEGLEGLSVNELIKKRFVSQHLDFIKGTGISDPQRELPPDPETGKVKTVRKVRDIEPFIKGLSDIGVDVGGKDGIVFDVRDLKPCTTVDDWSEAGVLRIISMGLDYANGFALTHQLGVPLASVAGRAALAAVGQRFSDGVERMSNLPSDLNLRPGWKSRIINFFKSIFVSLPAKITSVPGLQPFVGGAAGTAAGAAAVAAGAPIAVGASGGISMAAYLGFLVSRKGGPTALGLSTTAGITASNVLMKIFTGPDLNQKEITCIIERIIVGSMFGLGASAAETGVRFADARIRAVEAMKKNISGQKIGAEGLSSGKFKAFLRQSVSEYMNSSFNSPEWRTIWQNVVVGPFAKNFETTIERLKLDEDTAVVLEGWLDEWMRFHASTSQNGNLNFLNLDDFEITIPSELAERLKVAIPDENAREQFLSGTLGRLKERYKAAIEGLKNQKIEMLQEMIENTSKTLKAGAPLRDVTGDSVDFLKEFVDSFVSGALARSRVLLKKANDLEISVYDYKNGDFVQIINSLKKVMTENFGFDFNGKGWAANSDPLELDFFNSQVSKIVIEAAESGKEIDHISLRQKIIPLVLRLARNTQKGRGRIDREYLEHLEAWEKAVGEKIDFSSLSPSDLEMLDKPLRIRGLRAVETADILRSVDKIIKEEVSPAIEETSKKIQQVYEIRVAAELNIQIEVETLKSMLERHVGSQDVLDEDITRDIIEKASDELIQLYKPSSRPRDAVPSRRQAEPEAGSPDPLKGTTLIDDVILNSQINILADKVRKEKLAQFFVQDISNLPPRVQRQAQEVLDEITEPPVDVQQIPSWWKRTWGRAKKFFNINKPKLMEAEKGITNLERALEVLNSREDAFTLPKGPGEESMLKKISTTVMYTTLGKSKMGRHLRVKMLAAGAFAYIGYNSVISKSFNHPEVADFWSEQERSQGGKDVKKLITWTYTLTMFQKLKDNQIALFRGRIYPNKKPISNVFNSFDRVTQVSSAEFRDNWEKILLPPEEKRRTDKSRKLKFDFAVPMSPEIDIKVKGMSREGFLNTYIRPVSMKLLNSTAFYKNFKKDLEQGASRETLKVSFKNDTEQAIESLKRIDNPRNVKVLFDFMDVMASKMSGDQAIKEEKETEPKPRPWADMVTGSLEDTYRYYTPPPEIPLSYSSFTTSSVRGRAKGMDNITLLGQELISFGDTGNMRDLIKHNKPIIKRYVSQMSKSNFAGLPGFLNSKGKEYLVALIQAESMYDPFAVSPAGAEGLGQFLPGTAKDRNIDPYNAEQAIKAIPQHLKYVHRQLNDLKGAPGQVYRKMTENQKATAILYAYQRGEKGGFAIPVSIIIDPDKAPRDKKNEDGTVKKSTAFVMTKESGFWDKFAGALDPTLGRFPRGEAKISIEDVVIPGYFQEREYFYKNGFKRPHAPYATKIKNIANKIKFDDAIVSPRPGIREVKKQGVVKEMKKKELELLVKEMLTENSGQGYAPYPYGSSVREEEQPAEDFKEEWKSFCIDMAKDLETRIAIAKILVNDEELFEDILEIAGQNQSVGEELIRKVKNLKEKQIS